MCLKPRCHDAYGESPIIRQSDHGRPAELETAISRIVQECLTNIHRHSGSNSARIVIARDSQNVSIEIRDRGQGMPMPIRTGISIQGMGERVRQLGGHLEIASGSGGTRHRDLPC